MKNKLYLNRLSSPYTNSKPHCRTNTISTWIQTSPIPILHPVLTIALPLSLTTILYACFYPVSALVLVLNIITLKHQCKLSDKPLATPQGKLKHITYLTIAPTLTSTIKKAMNLIIAPFFLSYR